MDGRVGLPKGTLLDGSYRIERVIGSGGFGITYEAEDMKLGTKVGIRLSRRQSERAAELRTTHKSLQQRARSKVSKGTGRPPERCR